MLPEKRPEQETEHARVTSQRTQRDDRARTAATLDPIPGHRSALERLASGRERSVFTENVAAVLAGLHGRATRELSGTLARARRRLAHVSDHPLGVRSDHGAGSEQKYELPVARPRGVTSL